MKKSAGMYSVSTAGKPTEMTGVPQPAPYRPHNVLDGIVRGVGRGVYPPIMDGIVKSACSHKVSSGLHAVKPSATRFAEQEFGGVPYAGAKLGR
jgi:hypothetical protein